MKQFCVVVVVIAVVKYSEKLISEKREKNAENSLFISSSVDVIKWPKGIQRKPPTDCSKFILVCPKSWPFSIVLKSHAICYFSGIEKTRNEINWVRTVAAYHCCDVDASSAFSISFSPEIDPVICFTPPLAQTPFHQRHHLVRELFTCDIYWWSRLQFVNYRE